MKKLLPIFMLHFLLTALVNASFGAQTSPGTLLYDEKVGNLIFPTASGDFRFVRGPITTRGRVFDHALVVNRILALDVRGRGGIIRFNVGFPLDHDFSSVSEFLVEVDEKRVASDTIRGGAQPISVQVDLAHASNLTVRVTGGEGAFLFSPEWERPQTGSEKPKLLSPKDNSIVAANTTTLTWSPFPGARVYGISLVLVESKQAVADGMPRLWTFTSNTATFDLNVESLPGGKYLWSVLAFDARRAISGYSDEFAFTVMASSTTEDSLPTVPEPSKLAGHKGGVLSIALSPDGRLVASSGQDKKLLVRDVETNRIVYQKTFGSAFVTLSFSGDGKLLVGGGPKADFLWWKVGDWERYSYLKNENSDGHLTSLALARDGSSFLYVADNRIAIVDTAKGTVSRYDFVNFEGAALAPDGRSYFASGSGVHRWEVGSGKNLGVVWAERQGLHTMSAPSRGEVVACADVGDKIYILDAESGQLVREIKLDGRSIGDLGFSPSGKYIAAPSVASASTNANHAIRVWRVSDGTDVLQLAVDEPLYRTFAWSSDGRWLVAGASRGDGTIYLWDVSGLRG